MNYIFGYVAFSKSQKSEVKNSSFVFTIFKPQTTHAGGTLPAENDSQARKGVLLYLHAKFMGKTANVSVIGVRFVSS
jgi:hypothetical protein